ncbi:MAG: hypothetical protein LBK03_07145 [Bacteroidales bacterium]|jgi:hypothetical protein|nr:hypothetical protein [Bacteroidales bacterium]
MKKKWFLHIVLGVAVLFTGTSCEKAGSYHPVKKISKIYIQEEGQDKQLYAEWTWKGNNLAQIAYPLDNDTAHFSYNKGAIDRIHYTGKHPRYLSFQYDNRFYSKMNLYENDMLTVSCQFFYQDKKISKIIVMEYASIKSSMRRHIYDLFASLSLPDIAAESVETVALATNNKGDDNNNGSGGNGGGSGGKVQEEYSFAFTWNKENISRIITQTRSMRTAMNYYYDEEKNPFRGLQLEVEKELTIGYDIASCSKNNVTRSVLLIGEEHNAKEHSTTEIKYAYNRKYPVMATSTQNFADIAGLKKIITRWYEYK